MNALQEVLPLNGIDMYHTKGKQWDRYVPHKREAKAKWRGICQHGNKDKVHCNRKLIGARYFNKGYAFYAGTLKSSSFFTARDYDGHGSHTLSTVGGNFVPGASVFSHGNGTAKGGSPKARVAAYKVLSEFTHGKQETVSKTEFKEVLSDILLGMAAGLKRDPVVILRIDGEDLLEFINGPSFEVEMVSIFSQIVT